MKLNELRSMIRSMLIEKHPGMARSEMYSHIQFIPKSASFTDRWDRSIPGPQSMDIKVLRDWLDSNRVETIEVRGKRFSPRSFLARIAQAQQPPEGNVVPIVKGEPVHEASFISVLQQLVNEELWKISPPKSLRDTLPDIQVDAPSKIKAARKASDEYFTKHGARGVDPFTLDVEEIFPQSPIPGRAIVFRVPRGNPDAIKNAKMKGYRIFPSANGDVIYHPDHWDVGVPKDIDNAGVVIDPSTQKGLIPKTEEAKSIVTNAMPNVDQYSYPTNIDINDAEQGWEYSMHDNYGDDIDNFDSIVKGIIS